MTLAGHTHCFLVSSVLTLNITAAPDVRVEKLQFMAPPRDILQEKLEMSKNTILGGIEVKDQQRPNTQAEKKEGIACNFCLVLSQLLLVYRVMVLETWSFSSKCVLVNWETAMYPRL